jgi:hypothetical protein
MDSNGIVDDFLIDVIVTQESTPVRTQKHYYIPCVCFAIK